MNKLIVNFTPSGIGALKQARVGTKRVLISQEPLFCPVSANSDGEDFYVTQKAFMQQLNFLGGLTLLTTDELSPFAQIKNALDDIDRIELWVDPALFAYIGAAQFLHTIKSMPDIKDRLWINWLDYCCGLMNQRQILHRENRAVSAKDTVYDEASLIWLAYRHHTPEKWHQLRHYHPRHFEYWPIFNVWMLQQLPHHQSGIRQISRHILSVMDGGQHVDHIVGDILGENFDPPHYANDYNLFTSINRLASAYTPALTNISLPGYDYWDDNIQRGEEWTLFCKSKPILTPFGQSLLNGEANWRDYNTIDLWWGGTHITDNNYWSYDPSADTLFADQ